MFCFNVVSRASPLCAVAQIRRRILGRDGAGDETDRLVTSVRRDVRPEVEKEER